MTTPLALWVNFQIAAMYIFEFLQLSRPLWLFSNCLSLILIDRGSSSASTLTSLATLWGPISKLVSFHLMPDITGAARLMEVWLLLDYSRHQRFVRPPLDKSSQPDRRSSSQATEPTTMTVSACTLWAHGFSGRWSLHVTWCKLLQCFSTGGLWPKMVSSGYLASVTAWWGFYWFFKVETDILKYVSLGV